MTGQQLEKRRRVMRRSAALGHCICDVRQACPCEQFKTQDVCHCAGEAPPVTSGPVKLTQHVRNAGCASKISKGVLHEVLAGLPEIDDPRVLVGSSAGDDAGVIMLSADTATILTVDVFCPCVDDPYTFGQIAAANSLSDIYAMGAAPQVALSIIGFPIHTLPGSAMREILRGGADKMKEAGVPIVGGHSINDEEIKCGFAVVGTCPKGGYIRNAGARVGDAIVLTKPLGGGIVAFAHQIGMAPAESMSQAAGSMAALNKLAGELMARQGAHAATDVTGFSLLGHLEELVRNSGVEVELDFDRIPLFAGVADLARRDVIPGAAERNRESVDEAVLDLSQLAPSQQAILFGPETSGGLLVFLPGAAAEAYIRDLGAGGVESAAVVGRVTSEHPGGFIRVTTSQPDQFAPVAVAAGAGDSSDDPCCCQEAGAATAVVPSQVEETRGLTAPARLAPSAAVAADHLPPSAGADAFKGYMSAVSAPGAIGARHKKLMALALSVMSKCEPCIRINARAAREAGASDGELAEAVSLAIAFGGAPVAMFYNGMRGK